MSQSTRDRRDRILTELLERKHVVASALATDMGVSEATVRRDLRALAELGDVELIHGGATMAPYADHSFQARRESHGSAKKVIGQLAGSLVKNGDQLFIDSGTTCLEIAPYLRNLERISVLANSARLARELDRSGVEVIMIGGSYRPERMDCVGPIALDTLSRLRGFIALVGADGMSMDFGPSARDIDSSHLYSQAIKGARETILLIDSSKFDKPSLYKIMEWSQVDRLVTEVRPNDEWMNFLSGNRIEVIYPEG